MFAMISGQMFAGAAAVFAGVGGLFLGKMWTEKQEVSRRKKLRKFSIQKKEAHSEALKANFFIRRTVEASARLAFKRPPSFYEILCSRRLRLWCSNHVCKAGLAGSVTSEGLVDASLFLAFVAASIGFVIGFFLSWQLAFLGAVVGVIVGGFAPARSIKQMEQDRSRRLEKSLSEMLEVVSLGLRSGLSFDRSFRLYGTHFDSLFARECASACRAWESGLSTREDALRILASSYDSPLFLRAIETIIRSLRFGSSLSESLEAISRDARIEHRMRVEERVAKVPVKMMIPTGVLILPAMLLLVLGPVLLELMEGL